MTDLALPPLRRFLDRFGIPALIVVLLGALAYACSRGESEANPVDGSSGLEAIIPLRNAKVVAQSTVGVDLAPGYEGTLTLNDTVIPAEQLERDSGLNQLIFRPGAGKVIKELRPAKNCMDVKYWVRQEGEQSAGPPLHWCFDVV